MLYKIICFKLLCTFKVKVITCKTIKYVLETLTEAIISTPIVIHKWFNKPRIQHTKKHCKTSKVEEEEEEESITTDKSSDTTTKVEKEDKESITTNELRATTTKESITTPTVSCYHDNLHRRC